MDKELEVRFDQIDQNFHTVNKTIEKLAIMVAEGFSNVDKRFEQVDKRFEQVDKRFEQVDRRFDKVEEDIAELRLEIRGIRQEINDLPDVVDRIYGKTINNLLDRVGVIEKRLGIAG